MVFFDIFFNTDFFLAQVYSYHALNIIFHKEYSLTRSRKVRVQAGLANLRQYQFVFKNLLHTTNFNVINNNDGKFFFLAFL